MLADEEAADVDLFGDDREWLDDEGEIQQVMEDVRKHYDMATSGN